MADTGSVSNPRRWIRARYLLALALIGALVSASFITLEVVVSQQASTAKLVNVSGRQRMLSQRIALYSSLLAREPRLDRLADIRRGLNDLVNEMRRAHIALTLGSAELGFPDTMSADLRTLYDGGAGNPSIDDLVLMYLDHAQQLAEGTGPVALDDPHLGHVLEMGMIRLMPLLEAVVKQYQVEGEASVARIRLLERVTWGVVLLLLFIEARFIFRPMARRLDQQIRELDAARTIAAEHADASAEAHAKLQRTHEQLLQAEKMASVGQLAAGLAHELDEPVRMIRGKVDQFGTDVGHLIDLADLVQGCSENCPIDEQRRRMRKQFRTMDLNALKDSLPQLLHDAKTDLDRMRAVVNSMLGFAHPETAEVWADADLNDCVVTALTLAQREIGERAEIVTHFRNLPPIHCRKSQISELVLNLLFNAIQAMPTHGKITLRTGIEPAGKRVWLEVTDTGTGIAPAHLSRIFDPFFTTRGGDAAGLGLSVAWSITQAHEGLLTVHSELEKGTTFRFAIPCRTDARLADAPAPLQDEKSA